MSRKSRAFLILLALLAVAGAFGWRIAHLLRGGQPVFWLAELWTPCAVLSIGLVSFLEYLLPPR